jgi:hypothetical protein
MHSGQRTWPHTLHFSVGHLLLTHEQYQDLIRTRSTLIAILSGFSGIGPTPKLR